METHINRSITRPFRAFEHSTVALPFDNMRWHLGDQSSSTGDAAGDQDDDDRSSSSSMCKLFAAVSAVIAFIGIYYSTLKGIFFVCVCVCC